MARYRVQGEILRADTEIVHKLVRFDKFVDLEQAQDIQLFIDNPSPVTINLASYGLSEITDLYVLPDQQVQLTINGAVDGNGDPLPILVEELFVLRGTSITSLVLTNPLYGTAEVRVLFGGTQIVDVC